MGDGKFAVRLLENCAYMRMRNVLKLLCIVHVRIILFSIVTLYKCLHAVLQVYDAKWNNRSVYVTLMSIDFLRIMNVYVRGMGRCGIISLAFVRACTRMRACARMCVGMRLA